MSPFSRVVLPGPPSRSPSAGRAIHRIDAGGHRPARALVMFMLANAAFISHDSHSK
jgi:hypothetical protein